MNEELTADGPHFHVSSSSAGSDCVAVARLADDVYAVRHSKHADVPPILFTAAEWRAFVAGVKAAEFDF